MEITTPRQLHKTNTKYNRKTVIIFHYRTEERRTDNLSKVMTDVNGMYHDLVHVQ